MLDLAIDLCQRLLHDGKKLIGVMLSIHMSDADTRWMQEQAPWGGEPRVPFKTTGADLGGFPGYPAEGLGAVRPAVEVPAT